MDIFSIEIDKVYFYLLILSFAIVLGMAKNRFYIIYDPIVFNLIYLSLNLAAIVYLAPEGLKNILAIYFFSFFIGFQSFRRDKKPIFFKINKPEAFKWTIFLLSLASTLIIVRILSYGLPAFEENAGLARMEWAIQNPTFFKFYSLFVSLARITAMINIFYINNFKRISFCYLFLNLAIDAVAGNRSFILMYFWIFSVIKMLKNDLCFRLKDIFLAVSAASLLFIGFYFYSLQSSASILELFIGRIIGSADTLILLLINPAIYYEITKIFPNHFAYTFNPIATRFGFPATEESIGSAIYNLAFNSDNVIGGNSNFLVESYIFYPFSWLGYVSAIFYCLCLGCLYSFLCFKIFSYINSYISCILILHIFLIAQIIPLDTSVFVGEVVKTFWLAVVLVGLILRDMIRELAASFVKKAKTMIKYSKGQKR